MPGEWWLRLFLVLLVLYLGLMAGMVCGAPLDEALAIVRRGPVLEAGQAVLREQTGQRNWKASVSFRWQQQSVLDETGLSQAGPSAGFAVSIPLFDRSKELADAKARAELVNAEADHVAGFLTMVEALAVAKAKRNAADELRGLYRDELAYWKQAVSQGMEEAKALWPKAGQLKQAELDYRAAEAAHRVKHEAVARQYGGDEWRRLASLLDAIAK